MFPIQALLQETSHAGRSPPTQKGIDELFPPSVSLSSVKAMTSWKPTIYDIYTRGLKWGKHSRKTSGPTSMANRSRAPTRPLRERRAREQNAPSSVTRALETKGRQRAETLPHSSFPQRTMEVVRMRKLANWHTKEDK